MSESEVPVVYFDLASPYAYLTVARAESVLGSPVEFVPILLGAIFRLRGSGSWAATARRADGMSEVEARAARYGLPPLAWPADWPANSLAANRAATWTRRQGAVGPFARAIYHRQFAEGADITEPEVLRAGAVDVGLDADEMLSAIQRPEIKEGLRAATDEAWRLGVSGAPCTRVRGVVFYGDDRLDEAAARLASPT